MLFRCLGYFSVTRLLSCRYQQCIDAFLWVETETQTDTSGLAAGQV